MHIFTMPSTFHGPIIGNHDLKIIENTDIVISFLGNAAMNKIMGASTINKNDDLMMLNVANYLEVLWSREVGESIQGNDRFDFGRVEGGDMSVGSSDMATRGASTSSSETSSKMAIIFFCSLHL
jgi:hypothetical protein